MYVLVLSCPHQGREGETKKKREMKRERERDEKKEMKRERGGDVPEVKKGSKKR